jgi:hypothetical protein
MATFLSLSKALFRDTSFVHALFWLLVVGPPFLCWMYPGIGWWGPSLRTATSNWDRATFPYVSCYNVVAYFVIDPFVLYLGTDSIISDISIAFTLDERCLALARVVLKTLCWVVSLYAFKSAYISYSARKHELRVAGQQNDHTLQVVGQKNDHKLRMRREQRTENRFSAQMEFCIEFAKSVPDAPYFLKSACETIGMSFTNNNPLPAATRAPNRLLRDTPSSRMQTRSKGPAGKVVPV